MIKVRSTPLATNNSTWIRLEHNLISFNCNWDRLLCHCLQQVIVGFGSNIHIRLKGGFHQLSIVSALSTLSFIWVGIFTLNAICFDIFKGIIHQAPIAAQVTLGLWTVDQLLFREGNQVTTVNSIDTFQGPCWWEGPAGATWALVLDISHGILLSPINWFGESVEISLDSFISIMSFSEIGHVAEEFVVLLGWEVTQCVYSFQEASWLGKIFIVLFYVFVGLAEEWESILKLISRSVVSWVSRDKFNELPFNFR